MDGEELSGSASGVSCSFLRSLLSGQGSSVGRERHAWDTRQMALQLKEFLVRRHVPNPNGRVFCAGGLTVQISFSRSPFDLSSLTKRDFGGNHATGSEIIFSPDPPGRKETTESCVSTRLGRKPNANPPCGAPGRGRPP